MLHKVEGSWIQKGLDNAATERALMKHGPSIVRDLIKLVEKYAKEACQCDAMNGYQCPIHNQVREDIKELKDKYGVRL